MAESSDLNIAGETEFDALVCQISAELEESNDVSLSAYVERYPKFANRLACLFPTLQAVAQLGRETSVTPHMDMEGEPEHPPRVLGDYEIVREIGRGGMGVVYEATQLSLHRTVALKVLPFAAVLNPKQLRRFKDEAQIAARLNHQNIIPVYAVGCERGVHYYAMQFVDGRTTADLIHQEIDFRATKSSANTTAGSAAVSETRRTKKADKHEADYVVHVARIASEIADALHYAHEEGVVHRDIKPSNLMLDTEGKVWIADFGLARFESSGSLTMTGDILGTLRYMSPEQAAGGAFVDQRTDIYSLGATIYELVTLKSAHQGNNQQQLFQDIALRDPAPPRQANPRVPRDLDTIVRKAMEKRPRDRYASALELADDLRQFIANKPINASRPTLFQTVAKWARRNRKLVATAAICAATTLVLLTVGSMLAVSRINASWDEVGKQRMEAERQAGALLIEQGNQSLDEHDPIAAVTSFTLALPKRIGGSDEQTDRIRIGTTLRACPKLIQVFDPDKYIRHVALSADGNYIAFVLDLDTVDIYSMTNRELVVKVRNHGTVSHVQFSPVGTRILVAGRDGTAQVWEATNGAPMGPRLEHNAPILHGTFSGDGQYLATSDEQGHIKVWESRSGEPVGPGVTHGGASCGALRASFSPDGKQIVSATQFHGVRVWDVQTAEPVCPVLRHEKFVTDACFTLDGDSVWTATSDGLLRRWHVRRGELVERLATSDEQRHESCRLVFDLLGQHVLGTRLLHGSAFLYELDTGKQRTAFRRDIGAVRNVAFAPDGHRFVTVFENSEVRVWDMAHGQQLAPGWNPSYEVYDVAWTDDKYYCIANDESGAAVVIWAEDRARDNVVIVADNKQRTISKFSPGGEQVVTASGSRLEWRSTHGEPIRESQFRAKISNFAFSVDGRFLAVALQDSATESRIRILATKDLKFACELKVPMSIESLTVNRTATHVAISNEHGEASVWDAATSVEVMMLPHNGRVHSTSFDHTGTRIVTASEDGTARIWHVGERKAITLPLRHSAPLTHATFGPSDDCVATASADGTARLWNVRTGTVVSPPFDNAFPHRKGHGPALRRVYFRADGRELVTVSADGMLRFWDLSLERRSPDELIRLSDCLTGRRVQKSATDSGNHEGLEELFDGLRRRNPDEFTLSQLDATTWRLRQAENASLKHDWAAAVRHLNALIHLDRSRAAVWKQRARAHLELRDWEKAAADFEMAASLDLNDEPSRIQYKRCRELCETSVLVPVGARWKYLHSLNGVDPATHDADFHSTFAKPDFDDAAWLVANDSAGPHGGFGYGDPVDVDIGLPDPGNRKTAYFRCEFECGVTCQQLILLLQRDDGVIVYIDGVEVIRDNVAEGVESYDLVATSNPAYEERTTLRHVIDRRLSPGKHMLSISLHNKSRWSSDLRLAGVSLYGRIADSVDDRTPE